MATWVNNKNTRRCGILCTLLTKVRKELVYQFLVQYKLQQNGNSPSDCEISNGTGIPGLDTVHKNIEALEKDSRLWRDPSMGSRNLVVPDGRWCLYE